MTVSVHQALDRVVIDFGTSVEIIGGTQVAITGETACDLANLFHALREKGVGAIQYAAALVESDNPPSTQRSPKGEP